MLGNMLKDLENHIVSKNY